MKKAISTDQTPENITLVLDVLAGTPDKLESLCKGLSKAQAEKPLGSGERSVIEMVAHILHCESRGHEAITLALLVKEPAIVRIHPERDFGKLLQYDQMELPDLLAYLKFRRTTLLRVLRSLTNAQWSRVIREEGKARKESVYWQARGQATHEQEHLSDIESKVGALKR